MNSSQSVLKNSIDLATTPTFTFQDKLQIGLAWLTGPNAKGQIVCFHDGGTNGFGTFIGFNKSSNTGVIVFINSYCSAEQDVIGGEILKILNE
jgi:hypothetical protein